MSDQIKRFEKWIRRVDAGHMDVPDVVHILARDIKHVLSLSEQPTLNFDSVDAGHDIIFTGTLGNAGAYLLYKHAYTELTKRLPDLYVEQAAEYSDGFENQLSASDFADLHASAVYSVGEGGLLRTLYRLGKDTNLGYQIQYPDLPFDQTIIEFCEIFDMDPLKLFTCGARLIVAPASVRLTKKLTDIGYANCALIGQMTKDKKKSLVHRDFESLVNRPDSDELLNYCLKSIL